MSNHQRGEINVFLIPLILSVLLLIGAGIFGYWAYTGREDYKNNVDQKVSAAVTLARQQEAAVKEEEFIQREKLPFRTYNGPGDFGSITISYPKTWSAYISDDGSGSTPVDGYLHPSVVPSTTNQNNMFALRVQVLSQNYSDVIATFSSKVQSKMATVSPYALPKVPSVVGVRVEGQIVGNKTGNMVALPLRDKTLEIWTEGNQYRNDFNNNILPNFSFVP